MDNGIDVLIGTMGTSPMSKRRVVNYCVESSCVIPEGDWEAGELVGNYGDVTFTAGGGWGG